MKSRIKYVFLKDYDRPTSCIADKMKHIVAGSEFIGYDELYHNTHISSNSIAALVLGGFIKKEKIN